MGIGVEKIIDTYIGEYKKGGLFSKKNVIKMYIYPSHIEGCGFDYYEGEIKEYTMSFDVVYDNIKDVYIKEYEGVQGLFIEYKSDSIARISMSTVVLLGVENIDKWYSLIVATKAAFIEEKEAIREKKRIVEEENRQLNIEKEQKANEFYTKCYEFHIKPTMPVYTLFEAKNVIVAIYISEDKALNFLKIDGYCKEEQKGVIMYDNIHYYDRAGDVHYTSDIQAKYSSYGGSMTGGKFSKLATAGGGALFGIMGMALGAALTYKPAEYKAPHVSFKIDSSINKIDDRSVILNFYSDSHKQYIDIELPQQIFNFLYTYLPEKKYSVVDELEKQSAVNQKNGITRIEESKTIDSAFDEDDLMKLFKMKVEKLKIMKEAGIITESEFEVQKNKLLETI